MTDEEDMTARLLRLAGTRPSPTDERAARVQEAVRREWHAARSRRLVRRAAAGGMIALATAATIAVALVLHSRGPNPAARDAVLAVAVRTIGSAHIFAEQQGRQPDRALSTADSIRTGDTVETGASSRAALRAPDGSTIRLDHSSRVRFLASSVIEVSTGAAYVTTAAGSRGFEVRTPMGTVRDVGTQFEVRVSDASLRVRVRTGAVELTRGGSVTAAAGGTETTATANGVSVRQLDTYGVEWSWTADVAPPFAIDGQPLSAFLNSVVNEQGWRLEYGDPQLADTARRIVLHGSVEGLTPEEAVSATLATSGLHYRLDGGVLILLK